MVPTLGRFIADSSSPYNVRIGRGAPTPPRTRIPYFPAPPLVAALCARCYFRISLGAKMTPLDRGGFALVLVVQLLLETAPPFTDRGSDDTSPGPRCAPVLLTMHRATRLWIDAHYSG